MKRVYKIGCVGLLSDLPLFVAHAKEMFLDEGLAVDLTAELGWAGMEAKLSCGHLSAANLPAVMPLALSLRLGKIVLPMRVLLATSFDAHAITLTPELAEALTEGRGAPPGPIHLGIEAPYTQANWFAETWLNRLPADWRSRVIIMPLAISQVGEFFKEGYVQGICCSEPIGAIAMEAGLGRRVARSRDYFPQHLQSVLAARESFCATEETFTQGITNAVRRARHYCAESANVSEVMEIFSRYKSSAFASSALPRSVISEAATLQQLIGFSPREAASAQPSINDNLAPLIKACLALPGPRPSDQELRKESKRVYAALAADVIADLRPQ